jgi:sulfite reductase (ferredoxin)
VGYRCLATEVPDAIARLLSTYVDSRSETENLRGFLNRHSNEQIRAFLAGTELPSVPRDIPTQPAPHGIEG